MCWRNVLTNVVRVRCWRMGVDEWVLWEGCWKSVKNGKFSSKIFQKSDLRNTFSTNSCILTKKWVNWAVFRKKWFLLEAAFSLVFSKKVYCFPRGGIKKNIKNMIGELIKVPCYSCGKEVEIFKVAEPRKELAMCDNHFDDSLLK